MLEPGALRPQIDDQRNRIIGDVFSHLTFRSIAFGADYPFTLMSGKVSRLCRREAMTDRHRLYIFLLLSSLLRYIPRGRQHVLTESFERLVAEVLREWLPDDAEVHLFGTTAGPGSRYTGPMWQKINQLALDLGERVLVDESDFSPHDSGDLGLDVVAWLPLGDSRAGLPVWFAQATCQSKWKGKQHESGINWDHYLNQSAPRGNLLFVPQCFRDATGQWYDAKWSIAAVIIDRQRTLYLLRGMDQLPAVVPRDFVNSALEVREAV